MTLISKTGTHPQTPLVSIAMCTYNGSAYLCEQLDSVICQTYKNLEIIIIDDVSTDNTIDIITAYALKDNRISFSINETNLGYNKNFEKAIVLCSADYIAIADQDDIWEKNKIERMIQQWPAGSDFVYSLSGSFKGGDFAGRKPAPNIVYTHINDVHKLIFNSPVHGHACMFKKEFFQRCKPFPANIYYDWWMSMFAAAVGNIGCIPETLTWHREHDNNSSRNITSIKNKQQRNNELRQLSVYFIESFCNRNVLKQPEQDSLLHYASLLKQMGGKNFSWPMFRYILQKRKLVFHYKKPSPFLIFSNIKRAYRMAYKGLL